MNLFRKYIVLTLALLITISASGISISMHRCCGKIKDFSLLGAKADCKMDAKTTKHAFNPKHNGKPCCSEQKITIQKTAEATANKNQVKEKASFDVLFVLTFVRNWLGLNSFEDEVEEDEPSPFLSISESLTILFRQFRI